MRVAIFVGLIYVAWCINPVTFDTQMVIQDRILLTFALMWGIFGDIKDLMKKHENSK